MKTLSGDFFIHCRARSIKNKAYSVFSLEFVEFLTHKVFQKFAVKHMCQICCRVLENNEINGNISEAHIELWQSSNIERLAKKVNGILAF